MTKMTKPQAELLAEVAAGNGQCSEAYKPAQKLVSLGLCVWVRREYGSTILELTPAGRAALAPPVQP